MMFIFFKKKKKKFMIKTKKILDKLLYLIALWTKLF